MKQNELEMTVVVIGNRLYKIRDDNTVNRYYSVEIPGDLLKRLGVDYQSFDASQAQFMDRDGNEYPTEADLASSERCHGNNGYYLRGLMLNDEKSGKVESKVTAIVLGNLMYKRDGDVTDFENGVELPRELLQQLDRGVHVTTDTDQQPLYGPYGEEYFNEVDWKNAWDYKNLMDEYREQSICRRKRRIHEMLE